MEKNRIPDGYLECEQFFDELIKELEQEYKDDNNKQKCKKRHKKNNNGAAKVASVQNATK
jgi:hypothetical protein